MAFLSRFLLRITARFIMLGTLLLSLVAVSPAQADAPSFTEMTGADNPLNSVDVGYYAAPVLADLDGDGDLDAVIGEEDGILNYFRNDGTATSPSFTQMTGWNNPFNSLDVGFESTPTLGDIDGDADLDAFAGDDNGYIHFFRIALPEIVVTGNGQDIADGDSSPTYDNYTDFRNVRLGENSFHTFIISDTGLGNLILTGTTRVALSGDGASHFAVIAQPAALIQPGVTTTFQIRYTPSVTETDVATVTIANNDLDENPFDFTIQGRGAMPFYLPFLYYDPNGG